MEEKEEEEERMGDKEKQENVFVGFSWANTMQRTTGWGTAETRMIFFF